MEVNSGNLGWQYYDSKAGRLLYKGIQGETRGSTRGHCFSSHFNIMVEAVVHNWRHVHQLQELTEMALFYADNDIFSAGDAATVQQTVDLMTRDSKSIGIKMNAQKTEYMIMLGRQKLVRQSSRACVRIQIGEGMSHWQRSLEKVFCTECGAEVTQQYLKLT